MRSAISMLALAAVLCGGLVAAPARAAGDEGKVQITADVVLVSNQGNSVEPGLESMKERFAREHFNFTSYKKLSSETVWLDMRKPREIKLPSGKAAELKLLKPQAGATTVEVTVANVVKTIYTLGREGSVFVNTGHLQDGEVFLVLSPASTGK